MCRQRLLEPVWPDLAIFRTLGNFLKPLAAINLPKSPTFLGKFCKGVEIFHFSSEIIIGQTFKRFGDFLLVTLLMIHLCNLDSIPTKKWNSQNFTSFPIFRTNSATSSTFRTWWGASTAAPTPASSTLTPTGSSWYTSFFVMSRQCDQIWQNFSTMVKGN